MSPQISFHDVKDKSVFISGGGAGIGASLTEGFLAQGAKVAFIQRSPADELCGELTQKYPNASLHFESVDVTDISALQGALETARKVHGPIDILVNNAAWDNRHSINDTTVEEWDYLINVNLRHHFFAIQAVIPGMRQSGSGKIVNYSSISYMRGSALLAAYTAAKAGITGMTRTLARELGPDNIRVNALVPGWVMTERQKKLWRTEEKMAVHMDRQCLKQELAPEDMVYPTLFLASDASRMMTGQVLVVDGGVVASG